MKRFRDSELIVGVVVAIIAITTFANVTLITSSVTSVYIGWLSGVLSMNAALMITRANARIKAKREIEAQRASDKQVQAETYAAQRWTTSCNRLLTRSAYANAVTRRANTRSIRLSMSPGSASS